MRKALIILSCIVAIYGVIAAQSGAPSVTRPQAVMGIAQLSGSMSVVPAVLQASIRPATHVNQILVRATVELSQIQYIQ